MTDEFDSGRRDFLAGAMGAALLGYGSTASAATRPLQAPARLSELTARDIRSGRDVWLLRDVIGGRVAVLTFFFTGCSTVCPMQSMALSGAQPLLAGVLGAKAVFVSISIDWWGDTPRRIEDFARAHGAGPHWRFLKAPVAAVDQLRRGLESYDANRENHPPVIAIGKLGSARWSRLAGAPRPALIASEVRAWAG